MPSLTLLRALFRTRSVLAIEEPALRQQIAVLERSVKGPRLRGRDRLLRVSMRRLWTGWRRCLLVVRTANVVAWHRHGWRLRGRRQTRGPTGRPPFEPGIRERIRRLSREDRFWCAPRAQVEREHPGHRVAGATVEGYTALHGTTVFDLACVPP